jgi:TP901 family phage tail tape measure protein
MEQIFRIEIPVEAIDKTDNASLRQLESTLQKMFTLFAESKSKSKDTFSAVDKGAKEAADSIEKVSAAAKDTTQSFEKIEHAADGAASAQSESGSEAEAAGKKAEKAVEGVAEAYEDTASKAKKAGQATGSSFDGAGQRADKFTERMEKSNQQIQKMNNTKIRLVMEALDRATPVLKEIWGYASKFGSKVWSVAVRMKDLITAPFRKLYHMLTSPITVALSVAGIGLSANDLVTTFNGFEKGMSAVRALTGATDEEFLLLKQTAKDLGAETAFSATQASEGMQYLASSGWNANEIVAAMPGLLDLAAAGATELGTAADIVASVMTAMGMKANEATRAADVFAQTASASNASVEDLGETLKYAAPIAHSFGLSLEEVSAIAGMMANAGIKGSMAGTAIRSSLLGMASPSKEAAKLLKQLKMSFTNTDGTMKDMSVIVGDLTEKFSKLTEKQKLQYAETLFGTYGASAWLGVIDQGASVYDKFTSSLENSTGAAKEMATIRLDNLAGDMEALGGAVETAKLEIMDKLDPYLRSAVQWLTGKIPMIQEKIESAIDSVIEKVKAIKDHVQGVFDSEEFKDADGFAEKLFVAWDKIIVEPFEGWWNSGGRETVLGILSRVGTSMGEMLKGLFLGAFSAITGQNVDFEGFNMSGIAKAGIESATTFVSSFINAIDFKGLAAKLPALIGAIISDALKLITGGSPTSIISALLVGKGAVTAVKGVSTVSRLLTGLKTALFGVSTVAGTAGTATASVGATAATAATGVAKATTVLGGLKTVLAAIPVWGWVAAAVITAAAIGIKLYTDAQERHRQQLLHMGDSVEEAADNWRTSVDHVNEATAIIDDVKEVQLKLEVSQTGLSTQDVQNLKTELSQLESRKAEIEVMLAEKGLTIEEVRSMNEELKAIADKKAQIDVTLTESGLTADEVTQLAGELQSIQDRKAEIEAKTAAGGLTYSEIQAYAEEYDRISDREAEINAYLSEKGLTAEEIKTLAADIQDIEGREAVINAKLDEAGMTAEEISAIVDELDRIESRTAEINVLLSGNSLTMEQISELVKELNAIQSQKAEVEAKIAETGLTTEQLTAYADELNSIDSKKVVIEAMLADGSLTEAEVATYSAELAKITDRRAEIEAELAEQGLTVEQVQNLADQLSAISDREAEIKITLSSGGLTEEEVALIASYFAEIESKEASITATMSESSLTSEEITAYVAELEKITSRKAEIDVILTAASLTTEEFAALETELNSIKDRKAEIEMKIAAGGLTQSELSSLRSEYASLTDREATIKLMQSAEGMTQEQLGALNEELDGIYSREAEIKASMSKAGMTEEEIAKVSAEVSSIADRKATLNILLSESSLTSEEIQAYQDELDALYSKLIEVSNGLISQKDIENGKAEERIALLEKQLELEREIARINLEREVIEGRKTTGERGEKRDEYYANYEQTQTESSEIADARANMIMYRTQYELIQSQLDLMFTKNKLKPGQEGYVSDEALGAWIESTYYPTIDTISTGIDENVRPYAGTGIGSYEEHKLIDFGTDTILENMDADIQSIMGAEERGAQDSAYWYEQYRTKNADLVKQYMGEKSLIEMTAFKGTGLEGKTLEEVAAQYNTLGYKERELFSQAMQAFTEMTAGIDYLADADKIQPMSIWKTAYESTAQPEAEPGTPATVHQSARETISALQYRNATDENNDTLFTQLLKDNETAYGKLSELQTAYAEGKDTSELLTYFKERYGQEFTEEDIAAILEKIKLERQQIFNDQYEAITKTADTISAIDEQITATQQKIAELTEKAQKLQEAYDLVEKLKTQYGALTEEGKIEFANSEEGAAALKEINTALEGLGLDKITSLEDLSSAVASIQGAQGENTNAIDALNQSLGELTTDKIEALIAIEDALSTVQWNATNADRLKQIPEALKMSAEDVNRFSQVSENIGNCREQVKQLKTQLDDLKGTYDVTVNVKYKFSTANYTPGSVGKNAEGGIYDGRMLSWVAEDGPEAIIPLGSNRRERGLQLWLQAGEMMGITEFADGGIFAPYAGALSQASEYLDDDDDGGNDRIPARSGVFVGGGDGTKEISVSVAANPTFIIQGGDGGDIVAKIKEKQKEIADILGEEIAETVEDLVSNMV